MLQTRILTFSDLPAVLRLKEQAGWNQLPADLTRFLHLEPEGCFLAELEGAPVGTACGFLFGPVAWIAMVLVDEAHRGRGIGRELMNRVLDFVDSRGATTVRLDATALGRSLYETLGFTTQFTLLRYHGTAPWGRPTAASIPWGSPPDCQPTSAFKAGQRPTTRAPRVEQLPAERLDEVVELDRRITQTDRDKLIRRLFAESPGEFRIAGSEGPICGYLTSRPGSRARQIGPGIAIDNAGPLLLADALERAAGQAVFIDVPATHPMANDWLTARGFAPQRELLRMCRGAPVIEDINHLWASSGPEKG